MFTIENILKCAQLKGYKVFEDDTKPYNLNIWGVRNADLTVVNKFNDWKIIFWQYQGRWNVVTHSITTKPGEPCLLEPPVSDGAFIMKEGQYLDVYTRGVVHSIHPALVLAGNIEGYRDNTRDGKFHLDESTLETVGPASGVDIHGVWNAYNSTWRGQYGTVDAWSDACQVTQHTDDHNVFIYLVDMSIIYWGNRFSYTLVNQSDLE